MEKDILKGDAKRVWEFLRRRKSRGVKQVFDFEIMAKFDFSDDKTEEIMKQLEAKGLVKDNWKDKYQ